MKGAISMTPAQNPSVKERNFALVQNYVEKYPVLKFLVSPDGRREDYHHGRRSTRASSEPTIGERLFPDAEAGETDEFDRTAMNLVILDRLISGERGDYEFIVAPQTENCLSFETFKELAEFFDPLKRAGDWRAVTEYFLCVSDFGKTPEAERLLESIPGANEADDGLRPMTHGERLALLFTHGLVPGMDALRAADVEKIRHCLLYGFDIGQLILGEAPSSITRAFGKRLNQFEKKLLFAVGICDIAGSSGHLCQDGSPTLTETLVEHVLFLIRHLNDSGNLNLGDLFIKEQSKPLWLQAWSIEISTAAARISLMCGREDWSEPIARYLKENFVAYRSLIAELNLHSLNQPAIIPYFGPALLRCILDSLKARNGDFNADASLALDLGLLYLQESFSHTRVLMRRLGSKQQFIRMDLRYALPLAATNPFKL